MSRERSIAHLTSCPLVTPCPKVEKLPVVGRSSKKNQKYDGVFQKRCDAHKAKAENSSSSLTGEANQGKAI